MWLQRLPTLSGTRTTGTPHYPRWLPSFAAPPCASSSGSRTGNKSGSQVSPTQKRAAARARPSAGSSSVSRPHQQASASIGLSRLFGPQSIEADGSLSEGGRSYEIWLSRHWLPTLLSVHRSADNSPFSPEEIATIHSFVPHLRLALNLRQSQTTQELTLELIGRFLDRLGRSLIIVDGSCCVLYWTRGAAKPLGAVWSADYFTGLLAHDPIEGGKIQAAVSESILRGTTSKLHLTKIASRPLEATVFPLSHFDLAATSQVRFAAILVANTSVEPRIDKRNLMNLYSLTATEAKLATDLLLGKRVAEIARDRSVSIATVRAQVRAVLAKTETHRQLDLVRLLSQIASDGMPIGSNF